MIKKGIFVCLISLIFFSTASHKTFAIENPLARPNNIFGIHILFPTEVAKASQLVNSNGGNWGYVVIPMQMTDMNRKKWQIFMNDCKQQHIIPIIRLATQGDYFDKTAWSKPTLSTIVDFANFLNSLQWPVKNRYVILFNEVNRADEFGGRVNPAEYATLLSYGVTILKTISRDFFIISAGMDNAAANTSFSMNEYDYFTAMNASVPGIFNQIDGMASHSYPNPGFSTPPSVVNAESISSFKYERTLLESMSNKQLPVFITETGWPKNVVSDTIAAMYYQQAFATVWNDPNIVTVAPFLLQATGGSFAPFSLLESTNIQTLAYTKIASSPKINGNPILPNKVLGEATKADALPVKDFTHAKNIVHTTQVSPLTIYFFKLLLRL